MSVKEPDSPWDPPPESLTLESDEVHVWRATLDGSPSRVTRLNQMLVPEEREKADRFHFPKDRNRFIVARGFTRSILSGYLELDPGELQFKCNPYGKPALLTARAGVPLRFNISHSHGLGLCAVTHGREVGVDLERIRPEVATEQIAERYFSPREVAALRTLPLTAQPQAFFDCWTRKEAYIKARGEGLSLPLNMFSVTLAPAEPARLLEVRADPGEVSRWILRELLPAPGYAAAIAVEGTSMRLRCWQWPD